MTGNGSPLPEFSRPPLVEVALSVQFEPIALHAAHFGLFWQRIRSRFPKTSEQPPLPPVIERFGVMPLLQQQVQFGMGMLLPRCWFTNDEDSELLQLQSDRLILNWRKLGNESIEYPRYRKLRVELEQEYSLLGSFLKDERLGELRPTQCELTYVNQIVLPRPATPSGSLNPLSVFSAWQPLIDSFLPEPETAGTTLSFVMPGPNSAPAGRLYFTSGSSVRISDNNPMIQFQVICRGAPDGPGAEAVFRFMDIAHDWAVRGFASITSKEMQTKWGRVR
ncbi:MAG: TIGR04255 family protein [Candidatus Binatus sp.]